MFQISEVPSHIKQSMIDRKIWQEQCPVKFEQLKLLTMNYYDFDQNIQIGQMIVHQAIAEKTIAIFNELLNIKFPIAKMNLIDHYDGNDELSMTDNNSSSFNYRKIANSNQYSMHAYGLAIDINPIQNPYIQIFREDLSVSVLPKLGVDFLNRNNQRLGMVEPIVGVFKKFGLTVWGGDWDDPLDYHHFQIERSLIESMIKA